MLTLRLVTKQHTGYKFAQFIRQISFIRRNLEEIK